MIESIILINSCLQEITHELTLEQMILLKDEVVEVIRNSGDLILEIHSKFEK